MTSDNVLVKKEMIKYILAISRLCFKPTNFNSTILWPYFGVIIDGIYCKVDLYDVA